MNFRATSCILFPLGNCSSLLTSLPATLSIVASKQIKRSCSLTFSPQNSPMPPLYNQVKSQRLCHDLESSGNDLPQPYLSDSISGLATFCPLSAPTTLMPLLCLEQAKHLLLHVLLPWLESPSS
jgi:hypothetical protein